MITILFPTFVSEGKNISIGPKYYELFRIKLIKNGKAKIWGINEILEKVL